MKKLITITISLLIALAPCFASAVYFQDYDNDGDIEKFYLDPDELSGFKGETYEYFDTDAYTVVFHLDPARNVGREMVSWWTEPVVFPAMTIEEFGDSYDYSVSKVIDCPHFPNGTQLIFTASYELDDFPHSDTYHFRSIDIEVGYPNPGEPKHFDQIREINGTTYKILGGTGAFFACYVSYDPGPLYFKTSDKPIYLNTDSNRTTSEFSPLSGLGKTSTPSFAISMYMMDDMLYAHMDTLDYDGQLVPYYTLDSNGLNTFTIDVPYLWYQHFYDQCAAQIPELPDNSAFWDHHAGDFASSFWNLLKQLFGITWPGTKISILGVYLSVIATFFVISLAHKFVDFSFTIAPHSTARSMTESYRSSSSANYKIDKKREGDEY